MFQTHREAAGGGGELLVEAAYQEPFERDDRGDADRQTGQRQEHDQTGGELAAQGARNEPVHNGSGLSTYPTPRTVWIIGVRPTSIFFRR